MAGTGLGLAIRKWVAASSVNGPQADPIIDHPAPQGAWIEQEHIPFILAPDPGGVAPRAGTQQVNHVLYTVPLQHSPTWAWNPGSPYPGPPSRVDKYVDWDSIRWWGRTGQGQLVWSAHTEFSSDLPPLTPQDLVQHIDNFQRFWGGFPSMARNRPSAFGDQVPVLNPVADAYTLLAPG